jgi:hypothetical protein
MPSRLLYQARMLVLAIVSAFGVVVAALMNAAYVARGDLAVIAILAASAASVAFIGWLGWIDYVSATSLAIDARGVAIGGRRIPWGAMRSLKRATGAFRLALGTEAGTVRFQLLVVKKPIGALKQLVKEAAAAGAKVEPYLAQLAEHVEDPDVD